MNDSHDDTLSSVSPIPFRHILALLTGGVAVLTMGRVIYANAALCEMSGKNRGEIIGCSFLDLAVDADRPMVSEYLRHLEWLPRTRSVFNCGGQPAPGARFI
jgi:PAS domain S-box-containing protein